MSSAPPKTKRPPSRPPSSGAMATLDVDVACVDDVGEDDEGEDVGDSALLLLTVLVLLLLLAGALGSGTVSSKRSIVI